MTSVEPRAEPESLGGWLDRVKAAIGLKPTASIRDDLADALGAKDRSDAFTPQERAMLRNILGLRSVRVADVMVPRADIVAVPADIPLRDLLQVFRTQGHSRLPAYGQTLDDPRGMVHIRDFLDYVASKAESGERRLRRRKDVPSTEFGTIDLSAPLSAAKLLRPVLYAPPSMPAMDLLVRMQTTRTHIALVIDEYGGTDGLVSIEDLVEMIVGDIEDEHDEATGPRIEEAGNGAFTADARVSLEEVGRVLGQDFSVEAAAEEVETIGGLIVTLAQRVPSRGELIEGPSGMEFEVLDADPRRVKRVRIHRRGAPDPTAAAVVPTAGTEPVAATAQKTTEPSTSPPAAL
jgi:CBS domain containing-hemolysin-like protein